MKDRTVSALCRMKHILLDSTRNRSVSLVASFCAAWMLCVVPLVFRDAFFDINRIKVYTVYAGMAAAAAMMLLILLFERGRRKWETPNRHVLFSFVFQGVFLLSCLCSYFASGLNVSVLLGNQGRYCGLLFFLCCGMAFCLIACGGLSCERLHSVILTCASIVAFLGVLNVLGIDPLRFYTRVRRVQVQLFMSTIGHFDFFGTYLVLLLPMSGGLFVFSDERLKRSVGLIGFIIIALGAAASRTDSALIGMHLGCMAMLALSGDSWRSMSRASFLWAVCFAALPVMKFLLGFGTFGASFSGLHALLCKTRIAAAVSCLFAGVSAVFYKFYKTGRQGMGRRKSVAVMLTVFFIAVLLLAMMISYLTWINPEIQLGGAAGFLRFDDAWGSYRGFVYTRALDAYASFSPLEKLFGKGLDTTRLILNPYFDHPVIDIVGVFDDAHNQLLQLLLTGGLFCAGSFAAFYIVTLISLYRHAEHDPLLCGVFCSVFAYSIVMLINVTQPILIATYFSLCGLGFSRMEYNARKGWRHR